MKMSRRPIAIFAFCALCHFPSLNAAAQQSAQRFEREVRELYSNNSGVRAEATHRLVEAGPATIPALLPVLCDKSKVNFDVAWRSAAKALGDLKADAAAPCLVQMLALGDVTLSVYKPEATIAEYEPAFAALVQIGEPAIPAIERALPSLHPDQSYLALRVLRVINTPAARAAVEDYIALLEHSPPALSGAEGRGLPGPRQGEPGETKRISNRQSCRLETHINPCASMAALFLIVTKIGVFRVSFLT